MSESLEENEEPYDKRVYRFLKDHFPYSESFTKEELEEYIGYPRQKTFNTYFSKKIQSLLEVDPDNEEKFYVSNVFKRYIKWNNFKAYYSQRKRVKTRYNPQYYENVIIFEFYLPLNNESLLRTTLDDIFYKNTVENRLKRIPRSELEHIYQRNEAESESEYFKRLCDWISEIFIGYSIEHINGRFRTENLKTFEEVSKILEKGGSYLIDETTAVIRFIFRVGEAIEDIEIDEIISFTDTSTNMRNNEAINTDANKIRYFFNKLFLKSILEIVDGEDEIWMLESGLRNRLFIWKKRSY